MANKTGLRIMIVEDDNQVAIVLRKTILKAIPDADVNIIKDFDKARQQLTNYSKPDALILDLNEAIKGPHNEGINVWRDLCKSELIPVIIHTAYEGWTLDLEFPENNIFFHHITKGSGSNNQVSQHLLDIRPYINGVKEVYNEIRKTMNTLIYQTATVFNEFPDPSGKTITRLTRRRLAATMDIVAENDEMYCWEQYIYPPVNSDLMMGDILFEIGGNKNISNMYRLVLSPSCDLQKNNGTCKAQSVLVAKCFDNKDYAEKINSSVEKTIKSSINSTLDKLREKNQNVPKNNVPKILELKDYVTARLLEAQFGGLVPLPSFMKILPYVVADLRDLELIPMINIMTEISEVEGVQTDDEKTKNLSST